jgi:hypothetical protein
MNREALSRRLVRAEHRVAAVKAQIAKQRRLIAEFERDGEDATEAMRLIESFVLLQRWREDDRAKILDQLSQ